MKLPLSTFEQLIPAGSGSVREVELEILGIELWIEPFFDGEGWLTVVSFHSSWFSGLVAGLAEMILIRLPRYA